MSDVVRRAWDAFDAGDPAAFAAAVAPEWVERAGDGSVATLADALEAITRYARDYESMRTTFDQIVEEGDLVAVRTTTTATDRASGRTLTRWEIAIHRVENGLLAETWSQGATSRSSGP